jgi:hypothetical protein
MSTYAFRITCKLAGDYFALKENTSLAFPAPAPPIHVMLGKSKDWTNSPTLILQGGGFSSEKEARAAGIPVKTAVLLTGVLLGVGIDVGVDQVLSPAPQRRDGGQPDERWQPDVHGLGVPLSSEPKRTLRSVHLRKLVAEIRFRYEIGAENGLCGLQTAR